MSADTPAATMPFIGLRPFRREDADLFFGREDQVEELLQRLESHRFVAVVGTSGCGKSSLVRAGLIPDLENGFMAAAGKDWQFATLLPGNTPVRNLAAALVESGALGDHYGTDDDADAVAATLRRGPLGLVELLDEVTLREGTNLLIIVDQFEEIFRFRRLGDVAEAAGFVNLLLTAAASRRHPVHVVLTMRSESLGDCAVFPRLPEALNDAQFLVPRLTRSQLETAITGPAALFEADVDEALLNRILNDLGSGPDQLPLMQHALMRMWTMPDDDLAEGRTRVLDLDAFEAIGGLDHALSYHVSEVSRELTFGRAATEREGLDRIVRVLFRCLCDVTSGRDDIRRPATLSEVAAVASVTPKEVIRVVEAFRTSTCSFIMPPADVPLTPETILDIAHESLIRNWDELREWRDDEARWKEEYDRLVQSSHRWKDGKVALSVPPELDAQLAWRGTETIGRAWATRYGPVEDFELAEEYLGASTAANTARLERRRRTRFLLRGSIIGMTVALIAALFVVVDWWKSAEVARIDAEDAQAMEETLRKSEAITHERLKIVLNAKNKTLEDLRNERTNLGAARDALAAKHTALIDTEASLRKTRDNLMVKIVESEEDKVRLRQESEAASSNRRLAEGRMLAAEATVAATGRNPDLNRSMLLALRARKDLGGDDYASNRVLESGRRQLLPLHFVRAPAAGPVRFTQDLGDGGLLLVTGDGQLEVLDVAESSLERIGRLPTEDEPRIILPGPAPGIAVVIAGNSGYRVHRDGRILPLQARGYIGVGRGTMPDRLLVWGSEDNTWRVLTGMDESPVAEGALPCDPATHLGAALDAAGTGPVVICRSGAVLAGTADALPPPLDDLGRSIGSACVAPGGASGVTLSVEGTLAIHRFAEKETVELARQVINMTCRWEEDALLSVDEMERMTLWRLSTGERIAGHRIPGYDRWGLPPVSHHDLTAWADVHGNVHLWDWEQERELGQAPVGTDIASAWFTGTGEASLLWVGAEDGVFRGWVVDRRPLVRGVPDHTPRPSTPGVVGAELPDALEVYDPSLRGWLGTLDIGALMKSPDGETLAVHTKSFRLFLVLPKTREVLRLGVADSLEPAAFSTDSRRFASAGGGKGIQIWDRQGRSEGFLPAVDRVSSLEFTETNDAIRFEAAETSWEWDLMPLSPEALEKDVCTRLPRRDLNPEEWRRLLGPEAIQTERLCPDLTETFPRALEQDGPATEPHEGDAAPPPHMGGH
ncbi:MAG: NACHT and WD repeat domain-containing protein [Pseudomonadota bacterium]